MFEYMHRVQFYETDMMSIVHHSNYLRFYEEARVAWAHAHGLLEWQRPEMAASFAVLGTQVRHLKPSRFGDVLKIQVQGRLIGVRIVFEYKMWKDEELISEARTEHVSLDADLRPQRPSPSMRKVMEGAKWNETWLSNL
jgi:acyl-CoA thioester hydrolase